VPASKGRKSIWVFWGLATIIGSAALASLLLSKTVPTHPLVVWGKRLFLPGETSHGHHQIEMACDTCHTSAFGGKQALQKSCINCHGAELEQANDSHPKRIFSDPRNADQLTRIDASYCGTCHVEHKPEITLAGGVTVPPDNCKLCHRDIATERPSHKDLALNNCAAAGCHNYHDNRALYQDFLEKHLHEPTMLASAQLPKKDFRELISKLSNYPINKFPLAALDIAAKDAPQSVARNGKIENDWLATAHAKSGVNCSACHGAGNAWSDHPKIEVCATCHGKENDGWLLGRHGMRVAQKMTPMMPTLARLPMKTTAHDKSLTCNSCHAAHTFDVRKAAVEDCTSCHDDNHTKAYPASPHFALWKNEIAGAGAIGSGVSCSTCHLPRITHKSDGIVRTLVEHNQNDNLRPNSKMIRSVCLNCHGLSFSIDALSDPKLVANNFSGKPARHIETVDMAEKAQKPKIKSNEKSTQ
jgi:Cytochrome c3